MKEASYWDLLSLFHYLVIGGFLLAFIIEGFFLRITIRKRKIILSVILIALIFGTIAFALVIRTMSFPGGGLYDTRYDMDRVMVSVTQDDLEAYKADCGMYPTAEQGLQALVEKPSAVVCPSYKSVMKRAPDLKYTSDGMNYELESARPFQIKGLVVRGTNEIRSRLFLRDQ